jgi:hypothetical protein
LIADAIKSAVEWALEANSIEAAKAPLETVKAFNEQLLRLAVAHGTTPDSAERV